jgi:hypothetical protein
MANVVITRKAIKSGFLIWKVKAAMWYTGFSVRPLVMVAKCGDV